MLVGERVKQAREAAGMTQMALAKAANVTRSAISQLESGLVKKPSAATLLPLSRALRVTPEWLMTGKGEKRSQSVLQKRIAEEMHRHGQHPVDLEMLTRGKISAGTITQWLDGIAEPSDMDLAIVAPHLGMPADYFRTGKGGRTQDDLKAMRQELPIPWPATAGDINAAMIDDIAAGVCKATGAPREQIVGIIANAIIDHFTADADGIDDQYVRALAESAVDKLHPDLTGKERDRKLKAYMHSARGMLQDEQKQDQGSKNGRGDTTSNLSATHKDAH